MDISFCGGHTPESDYVLDEWNGLGPTATLINSLSFRDRVSVDYVDRNNTGKSFKIRSKCVDARCDGDDGDIMLLNLKNEIINVCQNKSKILLLAGFKNPLTSSNASRWLERLLRYFAVISCVDANLHIEGNTFENTFTPMFFT